MKKCNICLSQNECSGVDDSIAQDNCGFDCIFCIFYDRLTCVYGCDKCPIDEA